MSSPCISLRAEEFDLSKAFLSWSGSFYLNKNKYLLQLRNINISITIFRRKLLKLPNHMIGAYSIFPKRPEKDLRVRKVLRNDFNGAR